MTDNDKMREGELRAFLYDSIHEAYGRLSITGTRHECRALLDSIAAKVADDVGAWFRQAAKSVPVLGKPVAWKADNGQWTVDIVHAERYERRMAVRMHPLYKAPTTSIPEAELSRLQSIVKAVAATPLHQLPAGVCSCSQCELVRDALAAIAGEKK